MLRSAVLWKDDDDGDDGKKESLEDESSLFNSRFQEVLGLGKGEEVAPAKQSKFKFIRPFRTILLCSGDVSVCRVVVRPPQSACYALWKISDANNSRAVTF